MSETKIVAKARGTTLLDGDVCTVLSFKRGDIGVPTSAVASNKRYVLVIWDRDRAQLPRLVRLAQVEMSPS